MVPIGYIVTVALAALATVAAIAPVRRPRPLASLSFWLGLVVNELPVLTFLWLLSATLPALAEGDLGSPAGRSALAAATLTAFGLAIIARRGIRARRTVDDALRRAQVPAPVDGRRRPLLRTLLTPLPLWRRDVERIADINYGTEGRAQWLDLYRHRSCPAGAPVFVHFHGGHFRMGGKSREARALFHRLAERGWLCVSANYRLRAAGRFPASLVDAKRVIAWAREHAHSFGGDASTVVVAGSSAGAHLAAMAALSPNDPAFQRGFEDADTTVSAAVCLYGYYGSRTARSPWPSTPHAYVRPDAPPFLVFHGNNDTLAPAEAAACFAESLEEASSNRVIYVELPGAQHAFDLFHSPRFDAVIDGIDRFTACQRSQHVSA